LTSSPPSSELSPAVSPESPTLLAGNWQQGLRSLRDLTQHLTTRADDNHAPPVSTRPKSHCVSTALVGCQALVRFFALRRIKPHAPLLVRAPVNSFEFQPCGRTLAPHAFVPQRQLRSRKPPSPPVFLLISTHFTATLGIPLSSPALKLSSFGCSPQVKPGYFTSNLPCRLRTLYAQ